MNCWRPTQMRNTFCEPNDAIHSHYGLCPSRVSDFYPPLLCQMKNQLQVATRSFHNLCTMSLRIGLHQTPSSKLQKLPSVCDLF